MQQLAELERVIAADASEASGERWIVFVGDYIDRGPASADVVNHLMRPPPFGFRRFTLRGNHEELFLDFLRSPRQAREWVELGGVETATSYGVRRALIEAGAPGKLAAAMRVAVPQEHISWMEQLPISLSLPGLLVVHAGIRPGIPLDEQSDNDLLWIRSPFLETERNDDLLVVHGHTPNPHPQITPGRIGVDTGAFATGVLTAVRLSKNEDPRFLAVGR
jgi:serine/threonine protein phosphatase 1